MGAALGQGQEQSKGELGKTSGEGLRYCKGSTMDCLRKNSNYKARQWEDDVRGKVNLIVILLKELHYIMPKP